MVKAAASSSLQAANDPILKTLDVQCQQVSGHVQVVDSPPARPARPEIPDAAAVSYTHLRAHETGAYL
eukprot:7981562-Pyramimonas_sp.AAC.1